MKKLIFICASLLIAGAAHADAPDWQGALEQYKKEVQAATNGGLWGRHAFYAVNATATCSLSAVITGAAFIADTAPMTNIVAELIGNTADPAYRTYESIWDWKTLEQTALGVAGGGAIGMVETLEFITLWLGGNEHLAFNKLKQNYASTIATANSVFANQGQCMMSISKILITRTEMRNRGLLTQPVNMQHFEIPMP